MPKIQRIPQGDRPSVVVGNGPKIEDSLGSALTSGLGALAKTGYEISADVEAREAKRLREVMVAKQAIVDEVDAAKRGQYFDQSADKLATSLQEKYWNEPEKATAAYFDEIRKLADTEVNSAPNTDVGLHMARTTASRIAVGNNAMSAWELSRKTQIAKANIEEMANVSSAIGEQLPGGINALAAHLDKQKTSFERVFTKALGPEAGPARLTKLQSETTYAYFNTKSIHDPLGVMNALEATAGPAAAHLDKDQRISLMQRAKVSLDGLPRTRQLEALRNGISHNSEVAAAVMDGSMNPVNMFGIIRAAESEKEALSLDKSVGAPEKLARTATLNERLKFLNAADDLMRSQAGFDIPDKPGAAAEVVAEQARILKTVGAKVKLKGDNGLSEVLKQYTSVTQAITGGAITKGQGIAMIKQLQLAMPTAYSKEEKNTWHWGLPYQDSNEVGNDTINSEFKTLYPQATVAQKNDATFRFITSMNESAAAGSSVTKETARRLALESASLAMGKDPHGLFTGRAKK